MKSVFFTYLLVVVPISVVRGQGELSAPQQKLQQSRREYCITKTGVNPQLVANTDKGDVANDPKLKEHLVCMYKKVGLMAENGEFQEDVLKSNLMRTEKNASRADKIITLCAVKRATPQLTALDSFKCFYSKTGVAAV